MARLENVTPLIALDAGGDRYRDDGPRSAQGAGRRDRRGAADRRAARRVISIPPPREAGRTDPRRGKPHPRHRRCGRRRGGALRRRLARARRLHGRRVDDRPHARLRPRGAQARMRTRGSGLESPARALDTRLLAEIAAPEALRTTRSKASPVGSASKFLDRHSALTMR